MEVKNIRRRKRDTSEEMIINKRRKTNDSTNLDILISMKDARMDDKRYRLLKLGFKSSSEITDKSQSIVMSIFWKLKVYEDIIFSDEHSYLMNQMNFYQEEIKPKAKIEFTIAGAPESACTRKLKLSILIIRYACIWWIFWLISSKTINSWSY